MPHLFSACYRPRAQSEKIEVNRIYAKGGKRVLECSERFGANEIERRRARKSRKGIGPKSGRAAATQCAEVMKSVQRGYNFGAAQTARRD